MPEAERKREEGPDTEKTRPMDEFLEEFEQREKVFKEEVARAKEANAERKVRLHLTARVCLICCNGGALLRASSGTEVLTLFASSGFSLVWFLEYLFVGHPTYHP